MRIITISREFGSGGRELGKRIADELGFDYYDSEIVSAVARENNLDADYVEKKLDEHGWQKYPVYAEQQSASPSCTKACIRGDRCIRKGLCDCRQKCRSDFTGLSAIPYFCMCRYGNKDAAL